MGKTALAYLLASLFCAVFGAVYERFSHEVYSWYMLYAFLFPLAGGALVFLLLSLFPCRRLPGRLSCNLYHSGMASLTVGSIFQGVLDIYGTTNTLICVYWLSGWGMAATGAALYFVGDFLERNRSGPHNLS